MNAFIPLALEVETGMHCKSIQLPKIAVGWDELDAEMPACLGVSVRHALFSAAVFDTVMAGISGVEHQTRLTTLLSVVGDITVCPAEAVSHFIEVVELFEQLLLGEGGMFVDVVTVRPMQVAQDLNVAMQFIWTSAFLYYVRVLEAKDIDIITHAAFWAHRLERCYDIELGFQKHHQQSTSSPFSPATALFFLNWGVYFFKRMENYENAGMLLKMMRSWMDMIQEDYKDVLLCGIYEHEAFVLCCQQKWVEANESIQKALRVLPKEAHGQVGACLNRLRVYIFMGLHLYGAAKDLLVSIKSHMVAQQWWFDMGVVAFQEGEFQAANKCFRRIKAICPQAMHINGIMANNMGHTGHTASWKLKLCYVMDYYLLTGQRKKVELWTQSTNAPLHPFPVVFDTIFILETKS